MSDIDPGAHADAPVAPGSGSGPRLQRAPGERYAARNKRPGAPPGPSSGVGSGQPARAPRGILRALIAADAVALAGALVFFGLGLVDIGPGLLAASAAIGWAVALAILWGGDGPGLPQGAARMAVAGCLAAAAIVVGFVLNWAWARGEGGTLDLFGYLDQRYGAIAWANVLVAAVVGAWRAR